MRILPKCSRRWFQVPGILSDNVFTNAHGIYLDENDHPFCADNFDHADRKLTTDSELLMTLGAPEYPADTGFKIDHGPVCRSTDPFSMATNASAGADGNLFISDGYGNACMHQFSAGGGRKASWGEPGSGPGNFNLSHPNHAPL